MGIIPAIPARATPAAFARYSAALTRKLKRLRVGIAQ